MLITGAAQAREEVAAEDLHVAGEHHDVDAARQQLQHAAPPPAPCRPGSTGTWWKGTPTARASGSRSGWLETTATTSASSSPRRQRHSRSTRQWSRRETRIAMRRRWPQKRSSHSI